MIIIPDFIRDFFGYVTEILQILVVLDDKVGMLLKKAFCMLCPHPAVCLFLRQPVPLHDPLQPVGLLCHHGDNQLTKIIRPALKQGGCIQQDQLMSGNGG